MDVLTIVISIIGIAILSVPIALYVLYKKLLKFLENLVNQPITALFSTENTDKILDSLINNAKFQRFCFEVGALIGNGAKNGFGSILGGKNNLKGILGNALGEFLKGTFAKNSPTQENVATQNLNTNLE